MLTISEIRDIDGRASALEDEARVARKPVLTHLRRAVELWLRAYTRSGLSLLCERASSRPKKWYVHSPPTALAEIFGPATETEYLSADQEIEITAFIVMGDHIYITVQTDDGDAETVCVPLALIDEDGIRSMEQRLEILGSIADSIKSSAEAQEELKRAALARLKAELGES